MPLPSFVNHNTYQPAAKILRISSLLEIPPMSILPNKKLSVQAPTLLTVSIDADMNCYTILHMVVESS